MTVDRSERDLAFVDGRWRNRITGTYPSVLHFNGNTKHAEPRLERQLGYDRRIVDPSPLGALERRILRNHCPTIRLVGEPAAAPGPSHDGEALILGMAADTGVRDLEPFVRSLEQSGFRGRCCLFVLWRDNDAQAFLRARGVDVVVFDSLYERLRGVPLRMGVPERVIVLFEAACRALLAPVKAVGAIGWYRRLVPLPVTRLRELLFQEYLESSGPSRPQRTLFDDVKDVLIQRDPCEDRAHAGVMDIRQRPTSALRFSPEHLLLDDEGHVAAAIIGWRAHRDRFRPFLERVLE